MSNCNDPKLEYVRDCSNGCCAIYRCLTCGKTLRQGLPE